MFFTFWCMVGHLGEASFCMSKHVSSLYYLYRGMAKYIKTGLRKCKIKTNNNQIYSSNVLSLDFYFRYFSSFRIILFLNHVNCKRWRFRKFLAAVAVISNILRTQTALSISRWNAAQLRFQHTTAFNLPERFTKTHQLACKCLSKRKGGSILFLLPKLIS